jgi:putative transposase
MRLSAVLLIVLTYNTKLKAESPEDSQGLLKILEMQRVAFNEVSKDLFELKEFSVVKLHALCYRRIRNLYPDIPSQVVIKAAQECLASYKSAKSNLKAWPKFPLVKERLSMRLDKRLFSKPAKNVFKITTPSGRKPFEAILYKRLEDALDKYGHQDPLLFVRNDEIFISICIDVKPAEPINPTLALGVDLGVRVAAACSDGRVFIDRKFNKEKRRLRYLKRSLQSRGTKSARRHAKKLFRKELRKNKNQTFLLANAILNTSANVIALENLKGVKRKKTRWQCKNPISQVPLYDLRRVLSYKALNQGKTVVVVNPAYTSQTDSLTGKRVGERRGRRFYAKSGLVYDADLNAARNIGQRSQHPVSYGNVLDGQAVVMRPIVGNLLTSPRF